MDDAPSSAFADETPDDEVRIDWREPTDAELRRLLLGPDNLLNELTAEILRPRRQARLSWALTPEREQEAQPDQMRMPFGEVAEEEGHPEEGETAVEAAHRLLTDQRSPEEKAAEKKRRRKGEDAPEDGGGEG